MLSIINGFSATITCLITDKITDKKSNVPIQRSDFQIPEGITLADPYFDETIDIYILIGAGLFWDLLEVGQISLSPEQPVLQETKLGWLLTGGMILSQTVTSTRASCHFITSEDLHQ